VVSHACKSILVRFNDVPDAYVESMYAWCCLI
jgi:hypothetical protein